MDFLECYINGLTNFNKLKSWIDYWFVNNTHSSLQEFLGFSDDEYEKYLCSKRKFKKYLDKKYKK